jgi:hypothetical protein
MALLVSLRGYGINSNVGEPEGVGHLYLVVIRTTRRSRRVLQ